MNTLPLINKKRRQAWIYSSKEDTDSISRPAEVHEQEPCTSRQNLRQETTHSGYSHHDTYSSGSGTSPHKTIITMIDRGESPWDTNLEEEHSDTSTPAFKRGRHEVAESSGKGHKRSSCHSKRSCSVTDEEAIEKIQAEGLNLKIPGWIQARAEHPSVLLLADAQVKFWPENDKICRVIFHRNWPLKRWNQALKLGTIRLDCHTVVLYLESTRSWQEVPPIKNSLTTLHKTIHSLSDNPRIFVSNHLPRVRVSPIQYPILHSNFTLQQAVRSTSRALKGGVFEVSMYEHFTSRKGHIIKPKDQIFISDDQGLTWFSCLIIRECLMREVGIKTYWFDEHRKK